MQAELKLTREEIAAMIAANITNTWPCIPGHVWEATWQKYDDEVKVVAVKVSDIAETETANGVKA